MEITKVVSYYNEKESIFICSQGKYNNKNIFLIYQIFVHSFPPKEMEK